MSLQKKSFELSSPEDCINASKNVKEFTEEKSLVITIDGNNYPLIESWQYAGMMFGLHPIITSIQCLNNNDEIKYLATAEIRKVSDDKLITKGFAICSNLEDSKKIYDEYMVLSMAQTRAIGKAYKNMFSWIMKDAGYEGTPAEEMDFLNNIPTSEEKKILRNLVFDTTFTDDQKKIEFENINKCNNYSNYQAIKYRLEANKKRIDEIVNPSQKDIKDHIKSFI